MAGNFIYGLSPVLEAIRAGRRPIQKILLADGAQTHRLNELLEAARKSAISIERRERRLLDEMTRRANHQGVVALLSEASGRAAAYSDASTILDSLSRTPLLVLLDNIEDPHNLGAIIRTCDCAGVDGVFIPEHRAAGITDTVAKTSAGAVEHVRTARVTNLVPLIDELKERGIWVVGLEGNSPTAYSEFDFNVPVAIVMGSEGKGLRRLVRERCDAVVSIPMRGHVNSLNVSVATGVILFEILRQRKMQ
jgi:23S rRNA (guanosine2251-2'-O)-methyltransferase